MIRRTGTAVLVCALQLLACGDDDGGGNVSTGLPANAKLSSLDSADAEKLCTSLANSFNGILSDSDKKRITCTALALPLSIKQSSAGKIEGDVSKCKDLVSRCISGEKVSDAEPAIDVNEKFIDESSCKEAQTSENISMCEANVGEFEDCADAMLDTLKGQFDIINCDSLSDPEKLMEMTSDDSDGDSPPECEAINTKCPSLDFGGGDDGDDNGDDGDSANDG
ncbi:MAG TPA: hypothetical protein VFG30_09805 [Polyangiales bacterium]|nr:hypothetical protein [Polyangiales bacterium]